MLNQIRQQLTTFWDHQSKVQRIVLIALVGTGVILIPLFLIWANTPTYAVAFSGLSETDAGQIVEKLNEDNTPYQLRNSGTILVPSNQVYDVRLSMARQGLPQGGTVGFELFSGNTLGMTEFTQRVNYQRAIEGELERTISSLNAVSAVRVHIVTPEKTLLASEQAPATASITIKENPGAQLDAAQVRSITHLVASSVEDLQPENVVVVDVNGNLLASGEANNDASTLSQTDSHRDAEVMAAHDLQNKVQGLLDSALGPNKSVVQANVVLDWTQREKTTQSYDPVTAAVRSSSEVTETYTTTNGTLDGVPGAVSNLPPAGAGVTSENQGINYFRREDTTNYELTQVQSHEVEAPGSVKRVSLSVLVDGVTDQAQLAKLQSVIGAAAGIDPDRGDTLAVESLNFDRSYYETQAADLASGQKQDLYLKIGEAAAAILILGALLWYIQRLLGNLRLASAEAWTPVLKPVGELALNSTPVHPQLGGGAAGQYTPPLAETGEYKVETPAQPQPRTLPKYELPTPSPEDEQLQVLIKELADEDPSSLASIIQLWLNEDERNNG